MTNDNNQHSGYSKKNHGTLQDIKRLQSLQLFFLGGFIKSGTTWIERILDAHPHIACKGEAHFPSLLEPALRSAIINYNNVIPKKGNWQRLNNEGVQKGGSIDHLYTEEDLNNISALSIQLLMSKWYGNKELQAIGEKTPNNAQHFQRLIQLFPLAKYIYIIRDVRDVIVSGWFFNLALDPEGTLNIHKSIHQYGITIAKNWVSNVAHTLKLIDQNKSKMHLIKYEDLWHDPQDNTRMLLQFLQVEHTDEIVSSCIKQTDFSYLSGGRDRGTENRVSFYRKGVIGDWKNHLKHETLIEIEMYCGAMLDHLDYEQYQG